MILRRSEMVLCTRSLLIRGPNGSARVIQEGEHVRRNDPITRQYRAYFERRRPVVAMSLRPRKSGVTTGRRRGLESRDPDRVRHLTSTSGPLDH